MSDQDAELIATRRTLHEAMELQQAGNLAAAAVRYAMVVEANYRTSEVLPILAGILAQQGHLEAAVDCWEALLVLTPENGLALHEKALVLDRLKRHDEAIASLQAACRLDPDNVIAANNLGVMLSDAGRKTEALAEFRRALALQPDNVHVRHQVRRLNADQVPFWHIPMMNDTRRNDAFEAAIQRAINEKGKDAKLLDIGTGSGLLALMAARAGAKSVVTCEVVPVIAQTAREIVEANGYADRVAVHAKLSHDLQVGKELDERADILVSEILSSDLLTEQVLDTFEDAQARLLKRDATIIPRAASAMGCLIESETLASYVFVNEVSGFNLAPFNALSGQKLPIHGTMTDWKRLSDDIELVAIDLTAKANPSQLQLLSVPVSADGVACGIVQWMHVDLAEGISFDNHPDHYVDGGWLQVLHAFPRPLQVKAGQVLNLAVGHDRTTLIIQPFQPEPVENSARTNAVRVA